MWSWGAPGINTTASGSFEGRLTSVSLSTTKPTLTMAKNYRLTTHLSALLVACLLSATASAQFAGDLKFGLQLSPTFSYLTTDDNLINNDGSNLGLKLGLVGEYYIAENYSIHSGLGFHFNAGGTLFFEDRFERVDIWREPLDENVLPSELPDSLSGGIGFKYDLQYLEIPLGITLRTREFGYLRYWARPALHLGILTQSRGSLENVGFISSDEEFSISPAVNGVNLGWSINGGVEYSVSESTALFAGIGFQSGFADVTTDKDTEVVRPGRPAQEEDSKGRLSSIVIHFGVMF